MLFRKCIYLKRNLEMNKLAGLIELDESYFDIKHSKGKRGGGTTNSPYLIYLKEMGSIYKDSTRLQKIYTSKNNTR